jgi:hypothetical protein
LRVWAAAVGGPPPGVSRQLKEAASDLALAVDRQADSGSVKSAVSRFGWRAGHDGWPLTEIARWVEALATLDGARSPLLSFDAGLALSAGWSEGFLHGASQQDCIEPTTGLARLGVLQLRLQQVYEQCAALGIEPDLAFALVVVDASFDDHVLFERNAARVALAGEIKALFDTGETVAIHGDRVLILASRTVELNDRVSLLDAAVHTHPLLRRDHIASWVEHLPAAADLLPPFLADVVS